MVNSNQQQEKPQDFELIELLFQKIASTGSDPADQLDKSFEARFQSVVNQTQSYLHSSIKDGFFPHRALGWFSSVLDTKFNNKLGIKGLHFRFEGARTLKVVAEREAKTHVFIFTDNEGAQCKFTKDEWKDIKGNDFNNSDEGKLQIDVVKIIKSYDIRRGKQESDESIGPRQLYLYSNNDDVLEFKVRSSFGDIQTVQIERDESEGDFFDEIQQYLQGGDLSDGARERLLRGASEKGYTGFLVNIESDGKINSGKPSVSLEDFPFQEVKKKPGQSVHLESYIEKLANPDAKIDQVQDNLKEILTYIKEVHTDFKLQDNVYGNGAREADQHGFVAGVFDNFRYRDNTKLYLEQFTDGGYADIVLLVRGPDRAVDSVPILIELKAGTVGKVTPSDALEQAEGYIKGFRPNKMRILTNADNAIAVGLNLDYTESFKTEVKPIKQPSSPFMEEFIELIGEWDNQSASEEVLRQKVTDLLSSEYKTFPANKETKDTFYLSRYMFGASILIDKVDQGKVQSYVYSYGEYPLNWLQGTEHELSNSPVMTLIFVRGNEEQEKTAFVFHMKESNTREFYADKKIPVLNIPGIGRVGNVIEIKMSLKKYETGLSFEELFEIKGINKYEPSNTDQYFAGGEFIEIPNSGNLKEKFDQVIISHGVASSSTQEDLLQDYRELFNREIANVIYHVKDLIINEARLQAVLSGLFGSYSDLKVQQSASAEPGTSAKIMIVPEFQVGKGGRVDMVVQAIGPSPQGTKEYIPVGTELKLKKEVKCLPEHVDGLTREQMIRYANGEALKTIADGTEMYFIGVVFCQKAKGKDSLFLTSDKFVSASIDHSSEEIIEDICVIPEHSYDCKKIVDEAYEIYPGQIDDNRVFKLATCIKKIIKVCEEKPYPGLKELKDNLSKSMKNLVFASQVCIKNVRYGRYLYSPSNYENFQFDDKRRYVFTWSSKVEDDGKWKVELNDDNVCLQNVKYGRYLYSPNDYQGFQFNDKRRYVFTWSSQVGDDGKWKVELDGDNVYLRNVKYGRYLYSPNDYQGFQFDDKRRYVFTWPSKVGDNGKWKVEGCGSVSRRMGNTDASSNSGTVRVLRQERLDHKLLKAVQSCDLGKVKDLVSQGANIDAKDNIGRTPLHYAARNGYLDVVQFITKGGASLDIKDNDNKTASDLAFWQKHDNVVQYLKQVQLDKVDKELLAAAQNNDLNKVRDFITHGANIDTKNKDGSTLLYSAAEIGDLQRMGFLLTNGADTESKNEEYQATPLHGAVANFRLDAVKLLLSRGANVNAKDKDHWTPLHYAVDIGYLDIAKVLVDARANLSAIDNYGKTPLDLAKDRRYNNITEYLEGNLNKRGESHVQRKRRHLLNESLSSNNQPEIVASSGTRASSWVNDLFGWVKSSIGGLLSSKPVGISSTKDSISQVDGQFAKASVSNSSPTSTTLSSDGTDKKQESNYFTSGSFSRDNIDYVNANIKQMRERQTPVKFKPSGGNTILEMGDHYLSQVDFNGTIMLLDLLIRKATGQKYISTVDQSISPLEAQGYALNITKGFEKVVEQAALKSGISMHRLDIDYMGMQKEINRKVMSGKFNEISGILKSYVEKACPGREAGCPGKLSEKRFNEFMAKFNKGLDVILNQSTQQILHKRDDTLEVNNIEEQQGPRSYLNNTSIQGHLTRNKVKLIS